MRAWMLVIVMLAVLPGAARAQRPGGPFGGLFGRTPPPTGAELTSLEFRTATGAQFDDRWLLPEGSPDGIPSSGITAGTNVGLGFERRVDRLRFSLAAGSTYQQFFQAPRFGATTYDASSLLIAKVGARLSVDASATAMRSPFFQINPVVPAPGPLPEVPVPGERFSARRLANDSFEGKAGFTSQYSRRSTLSFGITHREMRFPTQPGNNFSVSGANGLWRHHVSKDLALRLGYGREDARTTSLGPETFVHETIDAGFDFEKELTLARRTAFSAFTQTSMLRENGGPRRYRLNGGASLQRGFKRSWSSSLVFNRTTEFVAGFATPLFSDALSAAIGGQLARRVDWTGGVGAGRSQVGFEGDGRFLTYSATSRLSAGLVRNLGLYAQYTFYHYEIPPGSSVVDLLPAMSSQSVSAGVSVWVPIIHRVRAPRDPR
ncbi:MAG: hypothetical protein ABI665_16710 [Vicinamibacterales bacterium]